MFTQFSPQRQRVTALPHPVHNYGSKFNSLDRIALKSICKQSGFQNNLCSFQLNLGAPRRLRKQFLHDGLDDVYIGDSPSPTLTNNFYIFQAPPGRFIYRNSQVISKTPGRLYMVLFLQGVLIYCIYSMLYFWGALCLWYHPMLFMTIP